MGKKNEPKPAPDKTLSRRVTKALSVKLTDEEVLKYGRDVARAYADRERIEAALDSIKAEYKGKIAEQDAIISKLSAKIRASGYSFRASSREASEGAVMATSLASGFPAMD